MSTVEKFIKAYVQNKLGKQTKNGNWSVINWGLMDTLQYQGETTYPGEWIAGRGREQIKKKTPVETIAHRLSDGSVLFNSNQLRYATKYSYGNKLNRHGRESDCQIILRNAGAIPIPFTIFDEVPGADVRDFTFVVKPVPETIIEKIPDRYNSNSPPRENRRHFSGACVFAIDKEMFLFDIDRQEIKDHGIFNAFVTKLPGPVSSIKEAYDLLMPDEVKKALSAGVDVKRQGEFFFIFESENCPVKVELTTAEKEKLKFIPSRYGFGLTHTIDRWDDNKVFSEYEFTNGKYPGVQEKPGFKKFQIAAGEYKKVLDKYNGLRPIAGTLGKSTSGSHKVEQFVKTGDLSYVSGRVSQQRREHGDLLLENWYKVVPNTAIVSFTITGNID